jgi:hypothetical protein
MRNPADLDALTPRTSPPTLRALIVRLCAWRALRPVELGQILGMRPDNLTRRHLSPMVELGSLVRTFPDNPNHPEQAYRARQAGLPGARPSPTEA